MDMGEHCTLQSCLVLTFLPVNCPYCRDRYCQAHFLPLQHGCKAPGAAEADRTLSDTEILKRIRRANARRREVQAAGPGAEPITATTKAEEEEEEPIRLPCQSAGCKRFSLYVDATVHQKSERGAMSISTLDGGHERRPFTHAAPRCDRCRGFFCMGHRSPVSHGCTAPAPATEGDRRRDAANERKRRAQEVLNKHFPNRSNR